MKLAAWRVRSLISGLTLLLFGLLVGGCIGVTVLWRPELLSWNVVTVVLVALFTLGPTIFGLSFLLELCEETEEDRRQQADLERLVAQLREDLKEDPLPNLNKIRG